MYRDEVVELMTETVNNYNRSLIPMGAMPAEQVEEFIKQNEAALLHMNGLLYDTLKENGVIN